MPSIRAELGRRRLPVRLYAGATAFLAGFILFAVGLFGVVHPGVTDANAPVNPTLWAILVTGLAVPVPVLIATAWLSGSWRTPSLWAGAFAAWIGVTAPAGLAYLGWISPLGMVLAAGAYGAGIVILLVAFFAAAVDRHEPTPPPSVSGTGGGLTTASSSAPRTGVAPTDGGRDDDDLEFLLDEDDDQDGDR